MLAQQVLVLLVQLGDCLIQPGDMILDRLDHQDRKFLTQPVPFLHSLGYQLLTLAQQVLHGWRWLLLTLRFCRLGAGFGNIRP